MVTSGGDRGVLVPALGNTALREKTSRVSQVRFISIYGDLQPIKDTKIVYSGYNE